ELKKVQYAFETIVCRKFDDNIYELYQRMKREEKIAAEEKNARKEKRRQQIQNLGGLVRPSKRHLKSENTTKLEDFDRDMQEQIIAVLRKKERKRRILIAACIFLCIVSFGYLGAYYQVSAKSAREFEELAALKQAGLQSALSGEKKVKIHLTEEDTTVPDILPEYEKVHQKNQKLIGWVKIDDTIIDYPVMQTVNNEYYLDHNFNQEEDRNGCIFMDYQCDVIKGCDNIILYGHHMKSGKMFGTLNKYSSESYFEEHPVIQFDTIYEKGKYQVMYVFRSKVYSEEDVTFKYYQFINAASEMEFNSYLNEMAALSLYDTGVTAAYGDKLLTLSTCDYQEKKGRFVVVAKKIG
ncbi:MAG: class B sortase, partial [Lachnospiraceae bacterium]|nr:class B sortase [Lachnospiraceae bacterium]